MAGFLLAGGIRPAPEAAQADVLIVNTCAFIEPAREEAAEAILSACAHKRAGGCRGVVVTGCLPQRYRARLSKVFPDVDVFLGVDQLELIVDAVRSAAQGRKVKPSIAADAPVKVYNPLYPTLLFSGGPFAYLKIAEGCNHHCAYCAIPNIRGAYRSRKREAILAEAEGLIRAGVRELNVISQDSLMYRDGKTGIVELLKDLAALKGNFRIRVLYGYPGGVTDELLDVLRSSKKFCRYLDLPVQHAHPEILRAMNRGDIAESVTALPERIRARLPGVALRTTCLLGFPGETEAHFEALVEFVKAAEFDHLGVFAYSPEEGTAALKMKRRPADAVAEARCRKLMAVQRKIAARLNRARIGSAGRALLLREASKGVWLARLDHQAPDTDGITKVSGVSAKAHAGDLIAVKVTGARGFDLSAEACG